MGIRCFLAFELPPPIQETLSRVLQEMKQCRLDIRWVREENIHLTMVFMGDIAAKHLPDLELSVEQVCNSHGPFRISLTGPGTFPGKRNPRVLWLGLDGELERMGLFRNALQEDLAPFGVEPDNRPFRPHLTMGRFRKNVGKTDNLKKSLAEHRDLTSPSCTLRELVLFKSDLRPTGAVYTRLNSWPLTGKQ